MFTEKGNNSPMINIWFFVIKYRTFVIFSHVPYNKLVSSISQIFAGLHNKKQLSAIDNCLNVVVLLRIEVRIFINIYNFTF